MIMAAFGVHVGSTSACLAVFKDDKTEVVANDLGDRVTPSVVAYTDHEESVGMAAKHNAIRNSNNTILHIKKILGKNFDDSVFQDYMSQHPNKFQLHNGDAHVQVEFKGKTTLIPVIGIAEAIYKKLLETARSHGNGDIHDSVLTVPVNFHEDQRQAISEAAVGAGFNVLRIISEPMAAAMAYDIGQLEPKDSSTVLVFRIGGESSNVSILHTQNGLCRLLGSEDSSVLSGSKFTSVLVEYLAGEFFRQYKLDCKESKRSMAKLQFATDTCKHTLSTLTNAQCAVDSLYEGVDFNSNVSRARFESLLSPLVQLCGPLIDTVCINANVIKDQIEKVILCGGGTKVPIVQKSIADYIPNAKILNSIPPDEVIALGAAKQAGILTGKDDNEIKENTLENCIECLSKNLCISASEETQDFVTIFPMWTPLPARRQENIELDSAQTSFVFKICECDKMVPPLEVTDLGQITMKELPQGAKVEVTFHLRREGSLHVTCREEQSKQVESLVIEVSSG